MDRFLIIAGLVRETAPRYRFTGANDSVRLKNGITCS
jgi:hypothetical protein